MAASHPRQQLHDAIASALTNPALAPGAQEGIVTRWVLVGELMLPNSQMALTIVHSTSSGHDLRTWEASGLLSVALHRTLHANGGP